MKTILRVLLIGFLLSICTQNSIAKPVEKEKASKAAKSFLEIEQLREEKNEAKLDKEGKIISSLIQKYNYNNTTPIYGDRNQVLAWVTELQPEGYIVTSTDDQINPIISYSFQGKFPFEESKQNVLLHLVKWDMEARLKILNSSSPEVRTLSQTNNKSWDIYISDTNKSVQAMDLDSTQWGPWVTTNWYQTGRYNMKCPYAVPYDSGSRRPVGCVATAMAQILNYWKFPASLSFGSGDSYTANGINFDADASKYGFPTISQLDSALSVIQYDDNDDEVAYLNFGAGVKLKMSYGVGGSGAFTSDVANVLRDDCFYGSATSKYASTGVWSQCSSDAIRNIKDGWPLQIGIRKSDGTGGHSVIVDGYRDSDEFFHVNFGWGGTATAWYNLPQSYGSYSVVHTVVFDICSAQAWNQYGADGQNTFRTNYPVPTEEPQRKWRCSTPVGYSGGYSKAIVVGASGRIYAALNPSSHGDGKHPSIRIINREGTPEATILIPSSDYSIDSFVQNERGDVYFACANGTYNTHNSSTVYRILSGSTQATPIFTHTSPDGGWPDENMKIDRNGNLYFVINPHYAANGSKIYSCDRNGNMRWQRDLGAKNCAYGTMPGIDGDREQVYLTYYNSDTRDNFLVAINNTTGTINYTYTFPDKTYAVFTAPTVDQDGTIYVGQYTKVYAFTPTLTKKWERDFYPSYIVNVALDSERGVSYASVGKLLGGVWHPGYVAAINTSNGSVKWEFEAVALGEYDNQGTMYAGINGIVLLSYSLDNGEQRLAAIRDFGSYGQTIWHNQAGSGDAKGGEIAFGPENTIYTVSYGQNNFIYALSDDNAEGYADYLNNNPPNIPSGPSPLNGSTNQPTNIMISWACSDPDPEQAVNLKYDIFVGEFGYDMVPIATNVNSTSYALSGLTPGTSYSWKVIATDGQAVTEGPTWTFSTVPPEPNPDINSDGWVDLFDLSKLAKHWMAADCIAPTWCEKADIDFSGDVGLVDVSILADNWLTYKYITFSLNQDPSWTCQGQWAFGQPSGSGGTYGNPDPTSGHTGSNVYGVNLTGDYSTSVGGPYSLTTGPIDCSRYHNVKLSFMRWLNTDDPEYVGSKIEVSNNGTNWSVVWQHTGSSAISDSNWQLVEYDMSGVADNQKTVYVRWSYKIESDRANAYSGWNIDDVKILGEI